MENSERYETLTPAEMAVLRKKLQGYITTLIMMAVIFVGLATWSLWRSPWNTFIIIFPALLLVLWFVSRGQLRSVRSLKRDIQEGKKKIIVDRMESQRQDIRATGNNADLVDDALGTSGPSMSYAYLLKVRGKEFNVSELQYYQCKPGQLIEIHLAPHSEHVFYLNILTDAATERTTA